MENRGATSDTKSSNEDLMNIKTVGVVGAGQMGNGIAQVAAQFGFSVVMTDISTASLEKGMKTIAGSCDRLIKKNAFTEVQKSELLGRIKTSVSLNELKDCDIIIEAATENIDLKLKIFK